MALFIKKNGALIQVSTGTKVQKDEEDIVVALDMASGSQIILPTSATKVMTRVKVSQPDTMIPSNIKNGVDIGGVVGTYEAVDLLEKRINGNDGATPYSYTNNNITYLEPYAFYVDENIVSFSSNSITTAKGTVNTRKGYEFAYTTNLVSINMPNLTSLADSERTFYNSGLINVNLPSLITPSEYCFAGCGNMVEISLPNLTTTKQYMFSACSSLTSVNLQRLEKMTNPNVFMNCSNLETIDLSSITGGSGGSNVFQNCSSLQICKLGNITSLGVSFFLNCTSLTDITLGRTDAICTLGNVNAFSGIGHQVTIHVPSNLISTYQTASNWTTLYNNGDVTFVAIQ